MFRTKTIFIVGAGGSCELGLPSGALLKNIIANKTNIQFRGSDDLISGDPKISEAITRQFTKSYGTRNSLNEIYEASRRLSKAMQIAPSIDNYLHTHGHDEIVKFVGKLAIAQSILEAEQGSRIFSGPHGDGAINFEFGQHWHNPFMRILVEGVERENIERIFENISFISFNYDRCIEHYIYNAIQVYFKIDGVTAANILNKLKIIHPFGVIGRLPWGKEDLSCPVVEFGGMQSVNKLIEMAESIRTFTEWTHDKTLSMGIEDLISGATRIIFLGFSFGRINMDLLSSKILFNKSIIANCYGISKENQSVIKSLIERSFADERGKSSHYIEFYEKSCASLIEDYSMTLSD